MPVFPAPEGDLRERFTATLTPMGGTCIDASDLSEVNAMIASRFGADAVMAIGGAERERHARIVGGYGAGVAETGSVWFSEKEYVVNSIGYIVQYLVVLLDPSQLVEGLQQVYRRDDFKSARYAALVTGPSATADIEGVLIRGTQGVRLLTIVWLA